MTFESKMKAADLAKKLRARLAVLKRERAAALKAYEKAFDAWKRDVAQWFKTGPQTKIAKITMKETNDYHRYPLPDYVFADMPKKPVRPTDKIIREIQKTIRFIAFTETPTISVSTHQLDEWFGEDRGDDDE